MSTPDPAPRARGRHKIYIALRQTADVVDERPDPTEVMGRGVKERIVAAVQAKPDAARLVRRAARVAQRLGGELLVAHLRRQPPSPEEARVLAELQELTASLGGQYHSLLGDSHRSRLSELRHGSTVHEIMRRTHGVDVYVIADED